jgi:Protein of unknown function (DUF2914)
MSMTGLAFLIAATSYAGELAVLPAPHVKLAIGYSVVDRQLERVHPDHVFVEGDRVVAWTAVAGVPAGFIEHVWSRDGVEVARQVLPVGSNRRWRSWSRHIVEPGSYEVRIIGPDGTVLGLTRFHVAELEEDC